MRTENSVSAHTVVLYARGGWRKWNMHFDCLLEAFHVERFITLILSSNTRYMAMYQLRQPRRVDNFFAMTVFKKLQYITVA